MDDLVDIMRRISNDPDSLSRIALNSVMSHGEAVWVGEAAWHAAQGGAYVAREVSTGGIGRVDLQIGQAAVEFKSSFAPWAFDRTDEQRDAWLMGDIVKLRRASVPALMVITVATLTGGMSHQRASFKVDYDMSLATYGGKTPAEILEHGVLAAEAFLRRAACIRTARLDIGVGDVPANGGPLRLAAVVGQVRGDGIGSFLGH